MEAAGEIVVSSGIYRGPCGSQGYRQLQTETCAAVRAVGNFDRAAMLLNDTVGHREPEARAFMRALGGEERIVDAAQVLRRDSMAGIRYVYFHGGAIPPGAHFESASARHGIARIQEEIQEYLLQ